VIPVQFLPAPRIHEDEEYYLFGTLVVSEWHKGVAHRNELKIKKFRSPVDSIYSGGVAKFRGKS
jgi:hypothetical protein